MEVAVAATNNAHQGWADQLISVVLLLQDIRKVVTLLITIKDIVLQELAEPAVTSVDTEVLMEDLESL